MIVALRGPCPAWAKQAGRMKARIAPQSPDMVRMRVEWPRSPGGVDAPKRPQLARRAAFSFMKGQLPSHDGFHESGSPPGARSFGIWSL